MSGFVIRSQRGIPDSMGLGTSRRDEIELDGKTPSQSELDDSAYLVREMRRLGIPSLMPKQRDEITKILERPVSTG